MERAKRKEKVPWSDVEIATVANAFEEYDPLGWMHTTFLMGLYQAARMQQCAVLLSGIDLENRSITYDRVKGDRPFTQGIDPRFLPTLKAIVTKQREKGSTRLSDIPDFSSLHWRIFLDCLDLPHLSHHGLRVTYITRAAIASVPQSHVMRFVNHASEEIHRIYQKLSHCDIALSQAAIPLPDLTKLR